MNFLYSLLLFGVRNYAHLAKIAVKLFVSLAGDTQLLKENSYMVKNLDLLASLNEKK